MSSRPGIPALTGVLLEADESGTLTLTTTDLEVSARLAIDVHATEGGTALVPARLLEAEVINGVWRATKLEGTFRVNQSAQLGCRSGSITTAFTATQVDRN